MCDFFDAKSEVSFTTPTIFQRSWKTALNWLDELFVRHIPVDSIKEMEQKEGIVSSPTLPKLYPQSKL